MKKLYGYLLFFIISFSYAGSNTTHISIAATQMSETDNLYFAEIDRYFYVGDALLFKAEVDFYLAAFNKNFGIGVFANFGSPWYGWYEEVSMTEFGPSFKFKINAGKVVFVPSLYIGYRSYEGDAGEALGLNLSVKVQYPLEKIVPFVDIGFLSQPAGGNDDTDITFSPVFIIGGGIGFDL